LRDSHIHDGNDHRRRKERDNERDNDNGGNVRRVKKKNSRIKIRRYYIAQYARKKQIETQERKRKL
jgi:hypothetical protein